MQYRVIGLMSGSSLDGLDIAFVHLEETAGAWTFDIRNTVCYPYSNDWIERLKNATALSAYEYLLLHCDYGHHLGQEVNRFIIENELQYQVQLIASHGHTSFHNPSRKMTGQLGDGSAIAGETGINVVSDLRALDIALGGQGAPIVPIGEKLLLGGHHFFLNLGGIANISGHPISEDFIAFDVCPANRILNMLAGEKGLAFDDHGLMAEKGSINQVLLEKLNQLPYYGLDFPKSLANDFGTDIVYPLMRKERDSIENKLRTYVEHICLQIARSIQKILDGRDFGSDELKLLATGGGVKNDFLVNRLRSFLSEMKIELVTPDQTLTDYKEALVMALMGVLRWREESTVLSSVTGASRDSIGGAVWIGQ